jgi:hypothetical protein
MVEYSVLSLLYLLSYFKLFVTLVKYIPQVSRLIKHNNIQYGLSQKIVRCASATLVDYSKDRCSVLTGSASLYSASSQLVLNVEEELVLNLVFAPLWV